MSLWKEHEHEQRIQNDIEDPSHGYAEACLAGTSDSPQQLGACQLQDGGNGSGRNDAQSILPGICEGIVTRPQKCQDAVHEHKRERRPAQRGQRGRIKSKGTHPRCFFAFISSKKPRDQSSPSQADDRSQGTCYIEYRQDQRSAGNHVWIAGPPDKKGICQIIKQYDQLSDDRRHRHGRYSPAHGQIAEDPLIPRYGILLIRRHITSFPAR